MNYKKSINCLEKWFELHYKNNEFMYKYKCGFTTLAIVQLIETVGIYPNEYKALESWNYVKDLEQFKRILQAEKEEGGWIVIEVNDWQMSGLSMIYHKKFYDNLIKEIDNKRKKDLI